MTTAVPTYHEQQFARLKAAYTLNNIPVPPRDERRLKRLSANRLASLADHWETRYQEGLGEDKTEEPEDEPPELDLSKPFPPNITIRGIKRVLDRMSSFRSGPHEDHGAKREQEYNGWGTVFLPGRACRIFD